MSRVLKIAPDARSDRTPGKYTKSDQDALSKTRAIFIQTVLANFYPKLAPCIRQTQFLSKFRMRPSKPVFFFFPTVRLLYVYGIVETAIYNGRG
jgi:hypothetical protein